MLRFAPRAREGREIPEDAGARLTMERLRRRIRLNGLSTSVMPPLPVVFSYVSDEPSIGNGGCLGTLLGQPEEDHPNVPRLASVEPERELVQIGLQVLST